MRLLTPTLFLCMSAPAWLAAELDFAHQIVPVLKKHCAECHMDAAQKGGFSMNTRESILVGSENGEVVVAGNAAESYFMEVLVTSGPERMPPKGPRLSEEEVDLIRQWIDGGMVWEPGFVFGTGAYEPPLKPRTPDLPEVVDGRDHPIDRIVDAYFAGHEIERPEPADDATFIRRATLDLVGLLPTPDEVGAFIADSSPDKREQLIDSLLARDADYAEHWLSLWNDLLRNDYQGTGYIDGGRRSITGWLYQALLTNKPYDQFAHELLAPPNDESSGFIGGIQWRGNVNASQTREVQFAQSITQTFLGLNMKCASCHDSFTDRWTLNEAYGLAAIYAARPIEIARCDVPSGRTAEPAWIFPELGEVDPDAPRDERLRQLAGLMTHPENGRFTRTIVNRLWHRLMGRGIVHPVDAMETEPWSEDLLDHLAVRFAEDGYDLRKALAHIASSQIYQTAAAALGEEEDPAVFRGPLPKRMTAEQFVDAVWNITGTAPGQAHDSVPRPPDAADGMVRAALVPSDMLMRALGRPNREQIVSMRPDNITTLEAIDLANGQQLAAALRRGAGQLADEGLATGELIESVYVRTLSRLPSAAEMRGLTAILGPQPAREDIEDFLWMIVMLPEFQFVR